MAGSLLRFAGQYLKPAAQGLKGLLIPRTAAGNVDKLALGMRYAPDLIGAGINAAILPEGASIGDRLAVGAEDLGIGLLASVAGQGMGRGVSRLAGKRVTPEVREALTTAGDMMIGYPAAVFAPRPIEYGIRERLYQQESNSPAQQQVAMEQQQQEMSEAQAQQELISLLLNAGAYGGRALS